MDPMGMDLLKRPHTKETGWNLRVAPRSSVLRDFQGPPIIMGLFGPHTIPIWMFPKIVGKPPKMDGLLSWKTPIKMDDLGGFPIFLETSILFPNPSPMVRIPNKIWVPSSGESITLDPWKTEVSKEKTLVVYCSIFRGWNTTHVI